MAGMSDYFSAASLRQRIAAIRNFVKKDLWRIRLRELPFGKSFLVRQVRIVALALRGYDEDNCLLHASALTFYTLLSIPSVVGMFFGFAKGFGFEKMLEKELLASFPGQELIVTKIIEFATSLLENTKGGVIAGVGVLVLFWSVLKVMGHIEAAFNHIWEVQENRSWGRKFSDYLAIMIVSPILVLLSSSATVFIKTQVQQIAADIALFGYISSGIIFLLRFTSYFLIWVLFTLLYVIMPNTKVHLKAGLLGGVIAGTIYQIAQMIYIGFQIGAAKASAIYGSFAALPLFLVWVQLSWMIVLFGAELAFANQNVDTYEYEPDCLKTSLSFRQMAALQIVYRVVRHLAEGLEPLTAEQLSTRLEIPQRLVNHLLSDLVAAGVLAETRTESEKEFGFLPARDINALSIAAVLEALNAKGHDDIPAAETPLHDRLSRALEQIRQAAKESPGNLLLKDL